MKRLLLLLRNLLESTENRIGFFLLLASGILFLISPQKVGLALRENVGMAINILLLTIVAVIISAAVERFVKAEFVERYFHGNRRRHLLYATVLGILTPGPIYAIYPIVFSLKRKGVPNHVVVSYITGQTIIGPARIPFEVGLLGVKFFIYRVILSVIIGFLAGFLYNLSSKVLPDRL